MSAIFRDNLQVCPEYRLPAELSFYRVLTIRINGKQIVSYFLSLPFVKSGKVSVYSFLPENNTSGSYNLKRQIDEKTAENSLFYFQNTPDFRFTESLCSGYAYIFLRLRVTDVLVTPKKSYRLRVTGPSVTRNRGEEYTAFFKNISGKSFLFLLSVRFFPVFITKSI